MVGPTPQNQDTVAALDVPRRFEIASDWFQCATEVANITKNPLAKTLIEFTQEQATVGAPVADESIMYFFDHEPTRALEDYFFLTPLIEEDAARLPEDDYRRKMIEGTYHSIAQYREGSHALYLPPHPMGKLGKGILLLHETNHAWNDITQRIDREAKDSHWIEEAEVYEFEFDLLSALIGRKYRKLVNQVADSIKPQSDDDAFFTIGYTKTDKDESLVANSLGVASDTELTGWLGVVDFNAFWEFFRKYSNDAKTTMAIFLRQAYGDNL